VLAGIPVGLVIRRWIVLLIPMALWVVPGVVFGVIPAISHGRGNPVVIMAIWGLYLAAPLAFTLGFGVAVGRLVAKHRLSER
jgi:hypothetical protein